MKHKKFIGFVFEETRIYFLTKSLLPSVNGFL